MSIGIGSFMHVHPWNWVKKRRTKASQYFVTLDLIPSNARQECVANVLRICLFSGLAVLLYTQTPKFVRAQICVGDMRVSRLQAKARQHHLSQTLVWQLPGLPGLLLQPCPSEMNRNSTVKIIQGSKFKFQKLMEKVGWSRPPHF